MSRKARVKLSIAKWAKIRHRYECGEPIKKIANSYEISPGTISNKASKEGWIKGDKLVITEVAERAKEKLIEEASDSHVTRVKSYLERNTRRSADMYQLLDIQLATMRKISREKFLKVQDAEKVAAKQTEDLLSAERARVAVEGGEMRPIERVQVDMPDMGRDVIDARRLSEMYANLDTIERRMLGLDKDGNDNIDENDPLKKMFTGFEDAREEYRERKERVDAEFKENADNLAGQQSDTEEESES